MKGTAALLKQRRLIVVSGHDAGNFLQGLISVDIRKLQPNSILSAGVFLNPKGRVLFDVFISQRTPRDGISSFDIETHQDSCEALAEMLRKYKLRKKVNVEIDSKRKVFAFWGTKAEDQKDDISWFKDPRPGHPIRYRVCTEDENFFEQPTVRKISEEVYHQIRIATGLVEGPTECKDELPFVLNLDWWPNALAFDKGCYTGQELVARTHFKGMVRKRTVPVLFSTETSYEKDILLPDFLSWNIKSTSIQYPKPGSVIEPIGNLSSNVGEGSVLSLAPLGGNFCLATFKDAKNISPPPNKNAGDNFTPTHRIKLENGEEIQVYPIRPSWWPLVESV